MTKELKLRFMGGIIAPAQDGVPEETLDEAIAAEEFCIRTHGLNRTALANKIKSHHKSAASINRVINNEMGHEHTDECEVNSDSILLTKMVTTVARLAGVKPEVLVKAIFDDKKNGTYLVEMTKAAATSKIDQLAGMLGKKTVKTK